MTGPSGKRETHFEATSSHPSSHLLHTILSIYFDFQPSTNIISRGISLLQDHFKRGHLSPKKWPKNHVPPTALVSPDQLHRSVAPSNTSRPPPACLDPLPLNKQLRGRYASHWRCGSHRHGATLWLPRPGVKAVKAINF